MEKTKEFIDSMMSGEKTTADSLFSDLIRDKVRTVLEIKKVELSSSIYNNAAEQVKI
jgi:hypothetical protein